MNPRQRMGRQGSTTNERTVVLKPCGKASLKLVDGNGEPLPANHAIVEMVVTPGASRHDHDAMRRGELAADADFISNIDRTNNPLMPGDDENGARTLNALIPGATYRVIAKRGGTIAVVKEFKVKPNETLDLGEIVVERE